MTVLRFELLTGKFHATPWGRHVNEGAVEWPPSPWRLYRALLATGHRKLGWAELPPIARSLFERLAGHAPTWWLPKASGAHTRHYMPDFSGKTARVIDAFRVVPPQRGTTGAGGDGDLEGPAMYAEIGVELDSNEEELLRSLVTNLSYLGRAESWVAAEIVDSLPALRGYERVQAGERPEGTEASEPIKVLGVLDAKEYLLWRDQQLDLELELQLARDREAALGKGKPAPRQLSKRARARIEESLPPTIVDALYANTAELQGDGWSQPPGTCWTTYWVPRGARSEPIELVTHQERRPAVQGVLFSLSSDTARGEVLPPMKDALLRGELFHAAAVARAEEPVPPELSGRGPDGSPLQGHRHVHYLPLCLNGRGRDASPSRRRIDHLLAWSPEPLPHVAAEALARVSRIFHGRLPQVFVSVVGTGTLDDFREVNGRQLPELGVGTVWQSRTPFVPPRFLKATSRNSLQGQVIEELVSRGCPAPVQVEVEVERGRERGWVPAERFWSLWKQQRSPVGFDGPSGGPSSDVTLLARDWRLFRRERLATDRKPPVPLGVGLRLTFAEPVAGPICIGYGSHYGLGVMGLSST